MSVFIWQGLPEGLKAKHSRKRETGQGLVEYALILLLLAGLAALSLNLMGVSLKDVYQKVTDMFNGTEQVGSEQAACENYFQTDFDDSLKDWDNIDSDFWKGDWETEKGKLVGENLGALLYGGLNGQDYSVSLNGAQLANTKPTYQGYGLIFRASVTKERLNGYMFEVEKKNKNDPGTMYFSQWINGAQIQPPLASMTVPKNFDWSNPGSMTVKVSGNEFTAYLNGVPLLQTTDDLYKSGQTGVAVNSGSKLSLDDFSVDSPACQEQ